MTADMTWHPPRVPHQDRADSPLPRQSAASRDTTLSLLNAPMWALPVALDSTECCGDTRAHIGSSLTVPAARSERHHRVLLAECVSIRNASVGHELDW